MFGRAVATTILAAGLLAGTAAHAAVFKLGDPGGSFDLGSGWDDQGDIATLDIFWGIDGGLANTEFSLDPAQSTTIDYGLAEFGEEVFIGPFEEDNLAITANIDLVLPEQLGVANVGVVGVVRGFTCDIGFGCLFFEDTFFEDVSVDFAPVLVNFGNGGQFEVDLSDVSFTDDESIVPITATFTMIQNPEETGIPEPATLALLGAGLVGLGAAAGRRRRV